METTLVLELGGPLDPGRETQLERINAAVEQLAEAHSWSPRLSYQVSLALEELHMNIVTHAYPPDVEPHSTISMDCEGNSLRVEIRDFGKPFNPLADTPPPDLDSKLEERRVGGLGVHLVKSVMDEIEYRRDGDCNCLVLKKTLVEGES